MNFTTNLQIKMNRFHQDDTFVICKTEAAWEKDRKTAGFGWIISGHDVEAPIQGSSCQCFIGSLLTSQ